MKENRNEPAYPFSWDQSYNPQFGVEVGLTKLELISAMCLQGMFANPNIKMRSAITKVAIDYAKELLKQLEAENE